MDMLDEMMRSRFFGTKVHENCQCVSMSNAVHDIMGVHFPRACSCYVTSKTSRVEFIRLSNRQKISEKTGCYQCTVHDVTSIMITLTHKAETHIIKK